MSHTLIIHLPAVSWSADTEVSWLLLNEQQRLVASGETAFNALQIDIRVRNDVQDFQVVAVAPVESVLAVNVDIPSTQLRQIRQALPFAIEELIADDIENVHTAIAANFRSSLPLVEAIVVSHKQLIEWLDLLHSYQLSPRAILVDALCLPIEPNSWSLCVDGERMVVRTSTNQGLAMQRDAVEVVLPSLISREQQLRQQIALENIAPPVLHVMASKGRPGDCDSAKSLADFLKRTYPDYTIKTTAFKQGTTQLLCYDWQDQKRLGVNLLQGGYSLANQSEKTRQNWSLVATVCGFGVALYLLLALGGGWYFNHRAGELEYQSIAIYRKLFPDERRVVNPRRQMQNHLRQSNLHGDNAFLSLLAETAGQMQGNQAGAGVTLNQIRFNSDQGGLRFEVNSRTLDELDQYKNQLAAGGLQVEINSASEQGSGVLGRLVITQR